jgi:hypothetical protein
MTLDKHQIDGIGGFSSKVLPANQFEESLFSAGYTITGSAPAKGGRVKVWWTYETFDNVESIYSEDKSTVITTYHV